MAYNSSKGPQTHGDVKFEGDAEDTQIDFETDLVALKTNGQQRFIVSGSAITASVILSSSAAISASAFFADGVALGASAVTLYSNSGNNRILTSVDSTTINGESALTFDGTRLNATGQISASLGVSGTVGHFQTVQASSIIGGSPLDISASSVTITGSISLSGSSSLSASAGFFTTLTSSTATISALTASAITGGSPISIFGDTITMVGGGAGSTVINAAHVSSSLNLSASAFYAKGVELGAAAISSYTNASNNRILTSVDSSTVNAEANLTFDSTSKFLFLSGNVQVRNHIPNIFFSNSAGTGLGFVGVNSSDNFVIQNNTTNKHVVFKTNDAGSMKEGLRINGAVPEVVVNESSDSLVDFRVESNANTHMLYVDGNANKVGVNTSAPSHTFAVSGSASVSGSFMVTGSMRAKALHMTHHNFAHGGTADVWIPWNSLIENTTDGEEHMMVTPFSGRLVKIMFRPEDNQNGNVTMNLYRALDGTKLIRNGALVEAITVSMGASDATTATFATSGSDHFGAGDAVGIKLDVNAAPGDCQLTCVWEFNQS